MRGRKGGRGASVRAMPRHHGQRSDTGPAEALGGFLAVLQPPGAASDRAWRIALAAMLAARYLERPVDLNRVLEMALVRTLPGSPAAIRDALDPDNGLHVHALLLELQTAGTSEARVVHALDAIMDGREPPGRDRFLRRLAAVLHAGDRGRACTG